LASRKGAPAARNRRIRTRTRPHRKQKRQSHHWLMRIALLSLIVISSTGLVGTAGVLGVVDYFAGDLPSIEALQSTKLTQTTRILDRNGNLIEALYHENRTVVPLSKISTKLQRATIATEDRTFYSNSGVDYRRLVIAIAYDLTHHSGTLGGSTITQQVVKNDVLDTEEAQSRTVSRKFRELLLAEELERRYSKQQILELYLNTINYGNGAYGAEAAAETYFQVHANDLSWGQASFLAGLPQAPSDYDPFAAPEQLAVAKWRWRGVLDGMVTVGDLGKSEADAIFKSDLIDKMVAAPQPGFKIWWWADALFMAPPVFARLGNATSDAKYFDAMSTMWWDTTDLLFDPSAGLYFRDASYLGKTCPNGQKMFWSRGNGWVVAGIVRDGDALLIDSGEVLLNDGKHPLPRGPDLHQVFAPLPFHVLGQHLGVADDLIERAPQVMKKPRGDSRHRGRVRGIGFRA